MSATEALALLAELSGRVDEDGFRHRHDVPARGQFRLRSSCPGCDASDAKHNKS